MNILLRQIVRNNFFENTYCFLKFRIVGKTPIAFSTITVQIITFDVAYQCAKWPIDFTRGNGVGNDCPRLTTNHKPRTVISRIS